MALDKDPQGIRVGVGAQVEVCLCIPFLRTAGNGINRKNLGVGGVRPLVAASIGSVYRAVASESEVAQSWPTLCDPIDRSLLGSSVHGIFQAIVLEWIAISFSNRAVELNSNPHLDITSRDWVAHTVKWRSEVKLLCHVQLFAIPWTVAYEAARSMGFSRVLEWVAISACNVGDLALIPGLERSPGGGHGNPLQYLSPAWEDPLE